MDRILMMMCTLAVLVAGSDNNNRLPWDKWSWSLPQQPIEYFFRRHQTMPIKSPNFDCKCPPNKECVLDFQINEAMGDFLNLRGIIKGEEYRRYQEDVKGIKEEMDFQSGAEKRSNARKSLKQNDNAVVDETNTVCCCAPRTLQMPSFITNKKYDEFVDSFDKKKVELRIQPQ